MSGVSVRTLHFYDEVGLLKPAYVGANGYRFYEEPQLLTLRKGAVNTGSPVVTGGRYLAIIESS